MEPCVTLAALLGAALWIASCVAGAHGKQYSSTYSFLANRDECDGQCTYCRHAHNQHRWSAIRMKLSRYVYRSMDGATATADAGLAASTAQLAADSQEVQRLIDWSWQKETHFECIIGIIALRLLSYGYSDPFQFNEGGDFNVLDFLDVFNMHTGALDLLTSSWAALLAGGWPVFRQLLLVSRKLKDRLADDGRVYPQLKERKNECDLLDAKEDIQYRDEVRSSLRAGGKPLLVGAHLLALRRGTMCPAGTSVALLSLALDLVRNRGLYQGSLKDTNNLVYSAISIAQDAVNAWAASKSNWSPFFDLLTTNWPIWELLSELACVETNRPCATRSALQCFDIGQHSEVPCPHRAPLLQNNFAGCGEHDICTMPKDSDPEAWCVPFQQRAPHPRQPWLLQLGHDEEERVCSQCGQDGVLRALFLRVGFREAAGASGAGGSPPFFVEFGARKPGMLNSAVLREHCRWAGILLDSQPGETPHGGCPGCPGVAEFVRREFVTAENVVELFGKHGVPKDFDLLTIDTDYNDYWIWRALLEDGTFRPRVVAVDFNPDLPLDAAKVVRYEARGEWDGSIYTVGSLLAYALMARAHAYSFAYALEMGSHAFFVRADLLAEADRALPLRSARKASHPPDPQRRPFVDVLYDFLPADLLAGRASARAAQQVGGAADEEELLALRREVRELTSEVQGLRQSQGGGGGRCEGGPACGLPVDAGEAELGGASAQAHPSTSAASLFYDEVRQRRGDPRRQ